MVLGLCMESTNGEGGHMMSSNSTSGSRRTHLFQEKETQICIRYLAIRLGIPDEK